MSALAIAYPEGATPLNPDELDGLIPDYITTQGELNELESANILNAASWAASRSHSDILNASFLFDLHKRMFSHVWRWAGTQRKSNKNIGVFTEQISTNLADLFADTTYWIEHRTYGWDELGARFHHRLVKIHPFVNGNGRHARLLTDILLYSHGQERFSWGQNTLADKLEAEGPLRQQYISALKDADRGSYEALLEFVRT